MTISYTYNNDGEITQKQRTIYNNNGDPIRTLTDTFTYRPNGSLLSESYNDGSCSYAITKNYTYDKANNRATRSVTQN